MELPRFSEKTVLSRGKNSSLLVMGRLRAVLARKLRQKCNNSRYPCTGTSTTRRRASLSRKNGPWTRDLGRWKSSDSSIGRFHGRDPSDRICLTPLLRRDTRELGLKLHSTWRTFVVRFSRDQTSLFESFSKFSREGTTVIRKSTRGNRDSMAFIYDSLYKVFRLYDSGCT